MLLTVWFLFFYFCDWFIEYENLESIGSSPWQHRSSDDPEAKVDSYSELEMMMLQVLHGDELREATKAAADLARQSGEPLRKLYTEAVSRIMEKYREEVLREIEATNDEDGASRLAGKGTPGIL